MNEFSKDIIAKISNFPIFVFINILKITANGAP